MKTCQLIKMAVQRKSAFNRHQEEISLKQYSRGWADGQGAKPNFSKQYFGLGK